MRRSAAVLLALALLPAIASAKPPLRYLVLGDSTAAGVGGNYEVGIANATARELEKRFG